MVTTQLLKIRQTLASSDVTVLRATGRSKFLTSDYPSVILAHYQNKFAQRFLPISPKLGLIFHTHTSIEKREEVRNHFVDIGERRTQSINDEIIKAAENLVFSTHRYPWLRDRVKLFRKYRFECVVDKVGPFIISQQRAVERKQASSSGAAVRLYLATLAPQNFGRRRNSAVPALRGAGTSVPTRAGTSEFGTLRTKLHPPRPAACASGRPSRSACHRQAA